MAKMQPFKGSTKRRIKIFIVFLLCSFLAWLVSKLSETYTDSTSFDLEFVKVPDTLLLTKASKEKVSVTLRASGWQFLGFNFKSKEIPIDLSSVLYDGTKYFVDSQSYRKQIEAQLTGSMTLLEMDQDSLFFDFSRIVSRKVPVKAMVDLNLTQNYLLDGKLSITPDSVVLKGPLDELDTIIEISTEALTLTDVVEDFDHTLPLVTPTSLEHTTLSARDVKISGSVFRFSEKIIQIPIEVINLPKGTLIRTFPNTIEVLCRAKIEQLKVLDPSDFKILADFNLVTGDSQFLPVELVQQPPDIPSVQLLKSQIEFILKRE